CPHRPRSGTRGDGPRTPLGVARARARVAHRRGAVAATGADAQRPKRSEGSTSPVDFEWRGAFHRPCSTVLGTHAEVGARQPVRIDGGGRGRPLSRGHGGAFVASSDRKTDLEHASTYPECVTTAGAHRPAGRAVRRRRWASTWLSRPGETDRGA